MHVRAHVRLVAAVWVTCQVAAFAAATWPVVLCKDHGVMSQTGREHECDPQHHHRRRAAHTATAHEHHQHGSESATSTSGDALVNCRCAVSDSALAALTLESGILTSEFVLETKRVTAPPPPRA